MSKPRSLQSLALVVLIALAAPAAARADDSLAAARDLYAAAAYEDALAMFDRLQTPGGAPEAGFTIALYRSFCLFALGRTSEAEQAIEKVVALAPSYRPTDADTSPRVLAAFTDVRRRTLPGIIQQKYAEAKAAFDRKEFAAAAAGFETVVTMLEDPDVRSAPALSDLRMVSAGFRDLSRTAASPPSAPPPSSPPPPPSAAASAPPSTQRPQPAASRPAGAAPAVSKGPPAAGPAAPKGPPGPRVYGAEDMNVVPPGIVRQNMPTFRFKSTAAGGHLTVAVVVDEQGVVENVAMIVRLDPEFDYLVQETASKWQYKPATLDGVPVKYRKVIQINVPR